MGKNITICSRVCFYRRIGGVILTIITLCGKAGSGKDYCGTAIKKKLEEKGNKVLITHYADLLKYICTMFFGWNGEKDEEGRHCLQYIGTDVLKKKKPRYFIDFIISILRAFPDEWDYVIIPDARFPDEVDEMRTAGFKTVSVKVLRPNLVSSLTEEQQRHSSEVTMDDYIPNAYLCNDDFVSENIDILLEDMSCD